jgi:hypothetical protein
VLAKQDDVICCNKFSYFIFVALELVLLAGKIVQKGNVTSKNKGHHQFNKHRPVVIPGESPTKKPQVLHVAVNKSFKNHLSSCYYLIIHNSWWL